MEKLYLALLDDCLFVYATTSTLIISCSYVTFCHPGKSNMLCTLNVNCVVVFSAQELKTDQDEASESEERCPVCGDKVSGYHYGLLTCESCKVKKKQKKTSALKSLTCAIITRGFLFFKSCFVVLLLRSQVPTHEKIK